MTQHNEFACCHQGCMALICLTPEQERMFRRTHRDFKCPMGHSQGFYGKTKDEKEIDRLKRVIELKDNMLEYRSRTILSQQRELNSVRAKLGVARRKLRLIKANTWRDT